MKRFLLYLAITAAVAGSLLSAQIQPANVKHVATVTKPISIQAPKPTPPTHVTTVTLAPTPPKPTPAPTSVAQPTPTVAAATPPVPTVSYPSDHSSIMSEAGISASDYYYVNYIVSRESGWCSTKWEGEYGICPNSYVAVYSPYYTLKGYGLCQSTPAIKMSNISDDWTVNPVTQMKWCSAYARERYGSWYASYLHWVANSNW